MRLIFVLLLVLAGLVLGSCRDDGLKFSRTENPIFYHSVVFPENKAPETSEDQVILISDSRTQVKYRLVSPDVERRIDEIRTALSEDLNRAIQSGEEKFEVHFRCIEKCAFGDNYQEEKALRIPESDAQETLPLTFYFTPKIDLELDTVTISISIFRNNIVYDHISFDVCIHKPGVSRERIKNFCEQKSVRSDDNKFGLLGDLTAEELYHPRRNGGAIPDVKFTIQTDQNLPGVFLKMSIEDTRLRRKIERLGLKSIVKTDQKTWRIRTSYGHLDDLESQSQYYYEMISCLVIKASSKTPNESGLTDYDRFYFYLRETFPWCGQSPKSQDGGSGNWGRSKARFVGQKMADLGNTLRFDLFAGEEGALVVDTLFECAAEQIEKNRSPTTVAFDFIDSRLPFQLLHPNREFDLENPMFLGFVADVADRAGSTLDSAGSTTIGKLPDMQHTALLGYKNLSGAQDIVSSLSASHLQRVRAKLRSSGSTVSKSIFQPGEFTDYLVLHANKIDAVWVYAHGDSRGWSSDNPYDLRSGAQKIVTVKEQSGEFRGLNPKALKSITARFTGTPLSQAPLVVLLACETNSPAIGATNSASFRRVLRTLGASSIIATEAEIPAITAQEFGERLVEVISNKDAVSLSQAIWKVRRSMYFGDTGSLEDGNLDLASLLFSYSGGHGVSWALM